MRRTVTYFDSAAAMYELAAELVFSNARNAVAETGVFSIALSGGSTPLPLYRRFSEPEFSDRFPWRQSHFFWGDERMAASDSELSNYGQAYEAFLSSVPVPAENIHRIRTELQAEAAARDYETELDSFCRDNRIERFFNCVLMGMGNDGHTASLFPGDSALNEAQRRAVAVPAPSTAEPRVPRITLTRSAFDNSGLVLFMLSGREKRELFERFAESGDSKYPASLITSRGRVEWFISRE